MAKRQESRKLRHQRVRARVVGTKDKPRMNIFRSLTHIYVQLIDDNAGKTLVAASSKELSAKGGSASGGKTEQAGEVGKLAAQKAVAAGIKTVVFDRGGYQYHGRVKQLADAARAAGLEF